MHIVIATGPIHAFPPPGAAGVQKVFLTLAREFVRRGHRVTVFAREWPGQAREEDFEGIRVVRRDGYSQGTNIWLDLAKDLAYAVRVRANVPVGDILITNDFWLPALLRRRGKQGGKLVVAAHRFPKRQYRLYRHADAFIAVSKSVASAIRNQQPCLASKVFTINNPLDASMLAVRKRAGCGAEAVIGSLGRIHPEKGVHLLLEAFKELVRGGSAARLKIAGPWEKGAGGGGEEYWRRIHRMAEGLPVEILGPLRNDQIAEFYESLDIYCLPSLADLGEAMPLAPLEAMACGVVPVVSDIAAFMEYIEDGANGLVFNHRAPDAPLQLAQTLERLVKDPETRSIMATRARSKAENFAPHAIADQYLAVFTDLLDGKRLGKTVSR